VNDDALGLIVLKVDLHVTQNYPLLLGTKMMTTHVCAPV
jgi:hypothetical protein